MSEDRPALRYNSNFHKLWAGQSISLIGTNVTYTALPLLAIYAINAGAFQVGLITLAETIPYLLVTLWAGAWIEGHRRIPTMLVADLGRAAVLVAIAVLTLAHRVNLEIILGLMLLYGVGSVFFEVAYYAVTPSVVRRSDLMQANSRLQTSGSFALLTGTNIGGVLTQIVTAPFALIVDAFTFVASAMSLRWMRVSEVIQPVSKSRRQLVWEGLRYVAQQPVLRSVTLSAALYNFFTTWVMTLFPVFAVRSLGLNAATIGFVQSFGAIGSALGALLAARMIVALGAGSSYIWSKTLAWAAVLSFGLTPAHNPATVAMLVVAFSVSGMLIVSNVVGITLRQAVTNDQMLGRMTASYKFISNGAQSLGGFSAGAAGALFGLRPAMVTGGILLVSTVLVSLVPAIRTLRDMPGSVPLEAVSTPATAAK